MSLQILRWTRGKKEGEHLDTQLRILAKGLTYTASALLMLGACTQQKPVNEKPKDSADIFSNRPIGVVPDVFVVTFEAPPIMKAATKTSTGWQVSDEIKNQILNEQAEFEQKLKSVAQSAEVVFRYRMTLNGLAIYAPAEAIPMIRNLPGVKNIAPVRQMARAEVARETPGQTPQKAKVNSATFIGAEAAYALGFRGEGMRVGVLDTGVDYTHSMLGGSGDKADFEAIDPSAPTPLFPNSKVVGGIDLTGTEFNAASPFNDKRLPRPDANPMDEAGHGTHVAGTVAGKGDGVNSYDGVAPEAQIYAIKVFGKEGSTMDAVVIAGFEYAADPNGDLNPDDQLDVINLSLGGGFGQPQILYTEAVRNLSRAGTLVVASAGNSGPVDYIVGAPGTSDEALSVAASIDGSPHNWQFAAVRFVSPNNPDWLAKATEGPISKPIAEITGVEGELFDIGLADVDLSEEQAAQLSGKVALIVRGKVPFAEKLKRAAAGGAIGAVVYNNEPGKPIPMGGDGKVDIPAIMVSQALGMKLLSEMKIGPVTIQFKTGKSIEEPELVDTITDFSSKGPRSEDNLLKPEIAAPGSRVISAAMGQGNGTVQMDGTSMAAPHMAGAMALIKQARPTLSSDELKFLAMNTAKVLQTPQGAIPISLQGAGRIQVDKALETPVLVEPGALSMGSISLADTRSESKTIKVRNIGAQDLVLDLSSVSTPGLVFRFAHPQVTVPAGGRAEVQVEAVFTMANPQSFANELNGRIFLHHNGVEVAQIPALAIRTKASVVGTTATAAAQNIQLTNSSPVEGMAMAFNLVGEDKRKREGTLADAWKSRSCDLQSVGYRILAKPGSQGPTEHVQFAFKLFSPLTTWHRCELSVLIDADEDGVADQELAGVSNMSIEGVSQLPFASVLLDATQARTIRLAYEESLAGGVETPVNYQPAVLGISPMAPFSHSSLAVVEMPLALLAKSADGKLNVKFASIAQGGEDIEADDYLGDGLADWMKIEGSATALPYYGMSEFSAVPSGGASLTLTKGSGEGKLILYYPLNVISKTEDSQFQILD